MSETSPSTGNAPIVARQLVAFAVVGAAAFTVHFGVVSSIVPFGTAPLIANIIGFAAAFSVSFLGHNYWSFRASTNRRRQRALYRFFAVASTGFVLNEFCYWLLLRFMHLPYRPALLLVLVTVAGVTWILSKYWAFADGGP